MHITPINPQRSQNTTISTYALMALVLKIVKLFESASFQFSQSQRDETSIFMQDSQSQSRYKTAEAFAGMSFALLTLGAPIGSCFAQGVMQQALSLSDKVLPLFSKGATDLLASYSDLLQSKKQVTLQEADTHKSAANGMDKELDGLHKSLEEYRRLLAKMNQIGG